MVHHGHRHLESDEPVSEPTLHVHLIDGTYELFRAYFAVPSRRSPNGQEVNAVSGLLQSLMALLRRPEVTHVACAFDHVIESFRNDLFAGYKTGEGVPADLMEQFELAERAVATLGVVVWPIVEFEADDALATGAARFSSDPSVARVLLCSPDKDLYQCVGANVLVWDRQRDKLYDEAAVLEKFGVLPRQIPDFLALVGDSADGIPGIPRWGKASAAKALQQFGSLEQIPLDAKAFGSGLRGVASLLAELSAQREQASLYKTLATLRSDVPLTHTLSDLEYRGTDKRAFEALCVELGLDSISSRLPKEL
ncbi:MAG TPA: 5'-3' exonuclease H3TH domain-containing protein, partial [Polyangiales bacterium]|nr:5'-3' exonuclease H3TH domain-containing protein [Polyangiales bacterium]